MIDLREYYNRGLGDIISYVASNYTDLISIATTPLTGELAYCAASEGTAWLPFTLGGTYYPAGMYRYDGANWVSDRNAIANQIDDVIHTDVASEISGITAKGTPTSADFLIIEDAADSNNKKSITIADLPSVAGTTNLSIGTTTSTTLDVNSDTGSNATIPASSITEAGLMVAADKVKLDSLSTTSNPFPIVQARRTTAFSLPNGTPTIVTFDTTEVENDDTIIEHDSVNTGRIYLHESQYYLGLVNMSFDNTANATRTVTLELYLNGTTLLSTISITLTKLADEAITRTLILTPFTAGDYISIRMGASGTGVSLDTRAVVQVIQQKAPKGDTGDTGAGANIIVQKDDITVGTVTDTLNFEGNDIDTVVDEGSGKTTVTINSDWKPNSIPLGSLLASGASFFVNGGAGIYVSMSSTADDAVLFNDSLNKSGSTYDGSDLALILHCRIASNGTASDTVGLLLDYAIVKDGDNTTTTVTNVAQVDYDVSAEVQDIQFDIQLTTMTGVVGADSIMITVTRNSTGAGADSYGGNFEIIGLEFVKL